ncbi:hypothetical protein ACQ3MN_07780 [Enterococcus faecalis]|uniref:hypothetical protein n=1 Tax=Enterococcus faecalis TaxID=1351 RepID=UPI003D784654
MSLATNEYRQELIEKFGQEFPDSILCNTPTDMSELCMDDIDCIGKLIVNNGLPKKREILIYQRFSFITYEI